jgi:hypothetical protein
MSNKYPASIILCASLLCAFGAGDRRARAAVRASGQAQAATAVTAAESFTATVKPDEARFTLPVPPRREWKWRQPETKERAQEYRMDVTVKNEGAEYTFGFYLWKFPGAKPRSGNFSALLDAGQTSLFERAQSRHMTILRDAGVKLKQAGDSLIIIVHGRKNVARLFSGRPVEVTFQTTLPGDAPTSKTVPVEYQD